MSPEVLIAEAIAYDGAPVTAAHEHAATLYDDESDLIAAVAAHLLNGGHQDGQRILVVATPEHRASLGEALIERGADPAGMRRSGDYLALDTAELLSRFMINGAPDAARFTESIRQALAAVSGDGRPPRVYGELVAVLWDEGNVTAAIEVETLWNELAAHHSFSLLCGYPMAALERHAELEAIRDVCRLHTTLVPPRRYRGYAQAESPSVDVVERSEVFLRVPEAVGGVRKWLRATFAAWDEHDLIDDASVVASELATNAIRHAQSPFRVTATRITTDDGRMVRLSFDDLSLGHPALNDTEHEQVGGRGVHLVAQLAWRWGVDSTPGGKTVWAEFRARERRSAPRS
jgi:anti-sigma regulatory factor (Ser/Thr protein kinase)